MSYDGLYTYFVKDFANDKFNRLTAQCVILAETDKSYKIRLVESIYNRGYDEVLWVRKKNVIKSHLNNESGICDKYNLQPADESCRACLEKCWRRYKLLKRKKVIIVS